MNKRFLLAVPVAAAALLAGVWFAQARYAPRAVEAPAVEALWQLEYPDLDGRAQRLAQWRGQVLVLNFWASWCAPCREEMPDFDAVRSARRNKGVEFVGIAIDNASNVSQFVAKQPVGYPLLIGEGAAHGVARALGNASGALPYTIVIDRDGTIALTHLGRLPRETLENALERAGA